MQTPEKEAEKRASKAMRTGGIYSLYFGVVLAIAINVAGFKIASWVVFGVFVLFASLFKFAPQLVWQEFYNIALKDELKKMNT